MDYREENNYPKAIFFSSLLMGLFLVFSYLLVIQTVPPKDDIGLGGIIVNYGIATQGINHDHMNVDAPATHVHTNKILTDKTTKPIADPTKNLSKEMSNKNILTQENEDAPTINKKSNKKYPAISSSEKIKKNTPIVNPSALYKGTKNNTHTSGDGTENTAGNQGSKTGDPLSANYSEGGSGFGDINLSLVNRRFVISPQLDDQNQLSGKVVVEIQVDKTGEVIFARAGAKGTSLSNLKLWRKCELAVLSARFNQLDNAPDIQLGIVIFDFKIK